MKRSIWSPNLLTCRMRSYTRWITLGLKYNSMDVLSVWCIGDFVTTKNLPQHSIKRKKRCRIPESRTFVVGNLVLANFLFFEDTLFQRQLIDSNLTGDVKCLIQNCYLVFLSPPFRNRSSCFKTWHCILSIISLQKCKTFFSYVHDVTNGHTDMLVSCVMSIIDFT